MTTLPNLIGVKKFTFELIFSRLYPRHIALLNNLRDPDDLSNWEQCEALGELGSTDGGYHYDYSNNSAKFEIYQSAADGSPILLRICHRWVCNLIRNCSDAEINPTTKHLIKRKAKKKKANYVKGEGFAFKTTKSKKLSRPEYVLRYSAHDVVLALLRLVQNFSSIKHMQCIKLIQFLTNQYPVLGGRKHNCSQRSLEFKHEMHYLHSQEHYQLNYLAAYTSPRAIAFTCIAEACFRISEQTKFAGKKRRRDGTFRTRGGKTLVVTITQWSSPHKLIMMQEYFVQHAGVRFQDGQDGLGPGNDPQKYQQLVFTSDNAAAVIRHILPYMLRGEPKSMQAALCLDWHDLPDDEEHEPERNVLEKGAYRLKRV